MILKRQTRPPRKVGEQILVTKQSSTVVKNFYLCAVAGWKSHYYRYD